MASAELEIEKLRKLVSTNTITAESDIIKLSYEIIDVFRRNKIHTSRALTVLTVLISSTIETIMRSEEQQLAAIAIIVDYLVAQSSPEEEE